MLAHDLDGLRRCARKIKEFASVDVEKRILSEEAMPWSELRISFQVALPTSMRADRLLAIELNTSRGRIRSFERSGRLSTSHRARSALHRPVTDGLRVKIDLSGLEDGVDLGSAAIASTVRHR